MTEQKERTSTTIVVLFLVFKQGRLFQYIIVRWERWRWTETNRFNFHCKNIERRARREGVGYGGNITLALFFCGLRSPGHGISHWFTPPRWPSTPAGINNNNVCKTCAACWRLTTRQCELCAEVGRIQNISNSARNLLRALSLLVFFFLVNIGGVSVGNRTEWARSADSHRAVHIFQIHLLHSRWINTGRYQAWFIVMRHFLF